MSTVPKASEGPQPEWSPPRLPDGSIDWFPSSSSPRDPTLGLWDKDHDEKREREQREANVIADLAKYEDAKARQAELKAGAPAPNRDATFASRTPRDILRRAAPPPYDFEDVPRSIGEFAWYFSQATGYDPSRTIVAAVTTAASVIDDAYMLLVRPESNWEVSARQWAVLCGDPSAGKSPCIRAATAHVKYMHHELYERWREANEGVRKDERDPVPALYTSDSTIPALSVALQANPRGLLMLTEEFASWVGGIDSADRGESAKNRGDWLQLRDGGPHQINRVERGAVYVPNWGVSVLAACTPDGLAKQMKQMPEDGLIQRFLPCIMATPELDLRADARDALRSWGTRLEQAYKVTTSTFPVWLTLSEAARNLFEAEERGIRELVIATEGLSSAYAAHLGKHPGMLAEVALTFHVFGTAPGHTPSPEVGEEAMRHAIRYMRKARRHAHTLYSSILSSAPAFELARALARSVVAAEEVLTTISRDWMTSHCQAFRKAEDRLRREAVQMLEDADWLSAETQVRSYGGWPRSYAVHHKVFELFAREGEQWRARRAAVRDMIGDAE